ncbi:MAG TPA: ZIP family metal transporter [Candidatus Coprovivens excrementavium]|nr:ZIP family metal transporter [Candidatus Coprovivens excrementavium]
MEIIFGISIPFIGTVIGSLMVYFMKDKLSKKLENLILGFAAGVMVAASIWSLIIPSLESARGIKWLPVVIGMSIGVLFFYFVDLYLKKYNNKSQEKINNLMVAITLHNIPEGMAVGIAFASYIAGSLSLMGAMALAVGIAIQNFPEGAIVSFPLIKKGYTKNKAFMYGFISAIFELLGSIITLIFTNVITTILPYFLALAAGAMFYVVVIELIPESDSQNKVNVLGFLLGFLLMMILDVTLG